MTLLLADNPRNSGPPAFFLTPKQSTTTHSKVKIIAVDNVVINQLFYISD